MVGLLVSLALLPLGLVAADILLYGVPTSIGLGCLLYLGATRTDADRWEPSRVTVPSLRPAAVPVSWLVPRLVVVGLAGLAGLAVAASGRPPSFLALAGIVGSLIVAQILFSDLERLDHRVVLTEIVTHAIVVRFAALFTTPGFIGIDNWTHVTSFAAAIREAGSLAPIAGIKYVTAPFYHLLTVAAAELPAVSLRTALYLTVGLALPLSVLLVYAAARYVTGVRWALLAALLFAVSDYVIYWGTYVSTNSLGLVFFLVVLFVLTRLLYVDVGRTDFVVLGAASLAVALTHHVSAFVTLVLLGMALVVAYLSRYVEHMALPNDPRYLTVVVAFLFSFLVVQWSVTPWMGGVFLTRTIEFVTQAITKTAGFLNLVESTPVRSATGSGSAFVSLLATYLNHLGFFAFLVVATIGSLALLRRTRSVGTYAFVGSISAMMVFLLGFPLFGVRLLVPERWYAFVYALMAVVAAVGVKFFANEFERSAATTGLLVLLLLFPTTMVMAHPATLDDPTFDNQWPKWAHTEPEVAAGETFAETVPEAARPIYTDGPYFRTLVRINEDPSARARANYAPTASADMFTVTEAGHVDRDQEPVVYRAYQSEGYPTYRKHGGVLTSRQLSAEQVCPETRNHVYTTEGVVMCTSPSHSPNAGRSVTGDG